MVVINEKTKTKRKRKRKNKITKLFNLNKKKVKTFRLDRKNKSNLNKKRVPPNWKKKEQSQPLKILN